MAVLAAPVPVSPAPAFQWQPASGKAFAALLKRCVKRITNQIFMLIIKKRCDCGREFNINGKRKFSFPVGMFVEGHYFCDDCKVSVKFFEYITGSGGTAEQIANTTGAINHVKKEVL